MWEINMEPYEEYTDETYYPTDRKLVDEMFMFHPDNELKVFIDFLFDAGIQLHFSFHPWAGIEEICFHLYDRHISFYPNRKIFLARPEPWNLPIDYDNSELNYRKDADFKYVGKILLTLLHMDARKDAKFTLEGY